MPITLPVPGGGGATNPSVYYGGTNLGEYQFISLSEIIDNFVAAYVGEGKILANVLKGDVNFKKNAADAAAKELAAQYNDQVSDELLKELYGNTDRTDFRIVQAFNYKNLKADKAYEGNSFEKFLEGKANTIQETDNIINKYQKKKEN